MNENMGEQPVGGMRPGASDALAAMLLLRSRGTVWRGFDVSDFGRWNQTQVQDAETGGRISTAPPLAQRRMQLRFVSDPGRRHFGEEREFHVMVKESSAVSRSELVHFPSRGTPEGAEYYYRWSTLFPQRDAAGNAAFPVGPAQRGVWQVITQWHQASDLGSPPILFCAKQLPDGTPYIGLELGGRSAAVWTTRLLYDVWHNFVLFVRYSNRAAHGLVRLWYSTGTDLPLRVASSWRVRTTASRGGKGPYLKHGLYRSKKYYGQRVSHIIHCGMVEGDSLNAVLP
jgi:hypothetical protein